MFNSIQSKYHAWNSFQSWEKILFFKMLCVLPGVSLCLRVFPYASVRRSMEPKKFPAQPGGLEKGESALEFGLRCARIVSIAARYCLPKGSCLPQALALYRFLKLKGYNADFVLGVDTTEKFSAHAWVELDGQSLDQVAAHFTSISRPDLAQSDGTV